MSIPTGHPEIDRQHNELDAIIDGLEHVCESRQRTGEPCLVCLGDHYDVCNGRLADLIAALLGFMLEHFTYEERLMRLLPPTEASRQHIRRHQQAHAEISKLLADLTVKLNRDDPRQSSVHLQHIATAWMGGHTATFDTDLAKSLEGAYDSELSLDVELTRLLAGQ